MDFNKIHLRKSFGRYKADDVEELLSVIQVELDEKAREYATLESRYQTEVRQKALLGEQLGLTRSEVQSLKEDLKEQKRESEALREQVEALTEQLRRKTMESPDGRLRQENEQLAIELKGTREDLNVLNMKLRYFKRRNEQQRQEIEQLQGMLSEDKIKEADAKARKILNDAVTQSEQMIRSAESVHTKAMAATRAAYFNTMSFRQSVSERFLELEHDLDNSLGILRSLDGPEPTVRTEQERPL